MATTTFIEPGSDATQDLSMWISSVGTVASDNAQFHTGLSSIKFSTGAGATTASLLSPNNILVDSGSQFSCYFMFDTLPSGNTNFISITVTGGGAQILNVQLNTAGKVRNNPPGGTAVNGNATLSINTWYRISVSYFVTNTTTFGFNVYVNGVLDSTVNAGTLTSTTGTRVRLQCASAAGANVNFWFDDIYTSTGGASSGSQPDTGDIRCTAKRPFSNGTTNGFTTQIGSGGSGYGTGHAPQVNERPLSTTNGWSMIGAGSAVTEEYNIESSSVGDVDISTAVLIDYMGWVYASAALSETGNLILNNNTSNISLTSSNTMFTIIAGSAIYPAGSGKDIGIITSVTVTTVSLYECGIVFAYTPSSQVASVGIMNLKTGWWGDL